MRQTVEEEERVSKGRRGLKIADTLTLPLDAQTSTFVVYGARGMGKTNFLAVFAEELARNELRFSVLDPVGVSWGLQHGASKERPGLPVLILGGLHADIPIEPTAGAVVADLVTDESVSTVVDVSRYATGKMWSREEKIRFAADYATRLFERQGEQRVPLMQIVDEAGQFIPQQFPKGAVDIARCAGAFEHLVELGRNVAVGVTLVTQRSARLNKSVSELADCMIAFRTVGPHSIDAVMAWLGEHIEKGRHNAAPCRRAQARGWPRTRRLSGLAAVRRARPHPSLGLVEYVAPGPCARPAVLRRRPMITS